MAGLTRTSKEISGWFTLDQRRWAKRGVWQRVFEQLATDADNEYAMIDSTIVRAHQHSAGAKGGRHRAKPLVAAKVD